MGASSGSAAGGERLSVTGRGFALENPDEDAEGEIVVTIDGVQAEIRSSFANRVAVTTGEKIDDGTPTPLLYAGNHGIRSRLWRSGG